MAQHPTDSIQAEITQLVEKMYEKRPPKTVLTVEVCVNVIRKRFGERAASVDWNAAKTTVASCLARLQGPDTKRPGVEGDAESESDDDDDEETDESDDEESEGSSSGDEEEESGSDDDEDDEESVSSAEGSENAAATPAEPAEVGDKRAATTEADESSAAPAAKKPRSEPVAAGDTPSDRLQTLLWVLSKIHHHAAKRLPEQSDEEYLNSVVLPKCVELQLDLDREPADMVKKYKVRKELAILQAEADITLDPKMRRGRFNPEGIPVPAADPVSKPSFVDED